MQIGRSLCFFFLFGVYEGLAATSIEMDDIFPSRPPLEQASVQDVVPVEDPKGGVYLLKESAPAEVDFSYSGATVPAIHWGTQLPDFKASESDPLPAKKSWSVVKRAACVTALLVTSTTGLVAGTWALTKHFYDKGSMPIATSSMPDQACGAYLASSLGVQVGSGDWTYQLSPYVSQSVLAYAGNPPTVNQVTDSCQFYGSQYEQYLQGKGFDLACCTNDGGVSLNNASVSMRWMLNREWNCTGLNVHWTTVGCRAVVLPPLSQTTSPSPVSYATTTSVPTTSVITTLQPRTPKRRTVTRSIPNVYTTVRAVASDTTNASLLTAVTSTSVPATVTSRNMETAPATNESTTAPYAPNTGDSSFTTGATTRMSSAIVAPTTGVLATSIATTQTSTVTSTTAAASTTATHISSTVVTTTTSVPTTSIATMQASTVIPTTATASTATKAPTTVLTTAAAPTTGATIRMSSTVAATTTNAPVILPTPIPANFTRNCTFYNEYVLQNPAVWGVLANVQCGRIVNLGFYNAINATTFKALIPAMQQLDVSYLSIGINPMTDAMLADLVPLLPAWNSLNYLSFVRNNIGVSGAAILGPFLPSSPREFYFYDNYVGNQGMLALLSSWKDTHNLRYLTLRDNAIDDAVVPVLTPYFLNMTSLTSLNLGGNSISASVCLSLRSTLGSRVTVSC